MNDRLIKYCERQHNVALGAPTVQLGTLEYYRTLDPAFAIADAGEATHTINLKEGVEIVVDTVVSNHLFGGKIGGEGLSITAAGPSARFSMTLANAYIFCVSRYASDQSPSLEHAARLDARYDSMWEIHDPRAFRDALGSALLETLTIRHLCTEAQRAVGAVPFSELSLQVQMMDQPVQYLDSREYEIGDPSDVAHVPDFQRAMAQVVFQKTKRDEYQCEYRFVYMVTHRRLGLLGVSREPIRIPLNRLCRLVSDVSQ